MRWLTITSVLLFVTIASALDPPTLLWEREYFTDRSSWFNHVIQTVDGGFAVAASVAGYTTGNRTIIKMDADGNIEWYTPNLFYTQNAKWVIQLADSSFVATGSAKIQSSDTPGVYIFRTDAAGNILWTKIYNLSSDHDVGWCVSPLPDGGFAVCGEYDEYDALLMRTDANGDTLWTRIYDAGHAEKAFRVLYWDNGLTVYVEGISYYGPHMLRYDMDGNLLWAQDYSGILPINMHMGGDMCFSSNTGYMIATSTLAHIVRTDWLGYVIWQQPIPCSLMGCGLSLNPTMDGGYIFCGWEGLYQPPLYLDEHSAPVDTGMTQDGWLVKLDSLGNTEWHIQNELGMPYTNIFNCARQLQGGGYIVAGRSAGHAYLLRYAPETGIEEGEVSPSVMLSISPNPFSVGLGISYSLPEPSQVNLSVYDLSGRLIEDLVSGSISAGENTSVWNPDPILPAGCYLIVLDTSGERTVRKCVKLD